MTDHPDIIQGLGMLKSLLADGQESSLQQVQHHNIKHIKIQEARVRAQYWLPAEKKWSEFAVPQPHGQLQPYLPLAFLYDCNIDHQKCKQHYSVIYRRLNNLMNNKTYKPIKEVIQKHQEAIQQMLLLLSRSHQDSRASEVGLFSVKQQTENSQPEANENAPDQNQGNTSTQQAKQQSGVDNPKAPVPSVGHKRPLDDTVNGKAETSQPKVQKTTQEGQQIENPQPQATVSATNPTSAKQAVAPTAVPDTAPAPADSRAQAPDAKESLAPKSAASAPDPRVRVVLRVSEIIQEVQKVDVLLVTTDNEPFKFPLVKPHQAPKPTNSMDLMDLLWWITESCEGTLEGAQGLQAFASNCAAKFTAPPVPLVEFMIDCLGLANALIAPHTPTHTRIRNQELDRRDSIYQVVGQQCIWYITKSTFTIGRAPKDANDRKRPDVDLRVEQGSKRISRLQVFVYATVNGQAWADNRGQNSITVQMMDDRVSSQLVIQPSSCAILPAQCILKIDNVKLQITTNSNAIERIKARAKAGQVYVEKVGKSGVQGA